jgi:ATP-dependent RNA helicase RhlE
VGQKLEKAGIAAAAIHGNKSQTARTKALDSFKSGKVRVLVATDIAARGIDVSGISHVINFDMPIEPETYVHRIGRTARAGSRGDAISFCCAPERDYLRAIERLVRIPIPVDTGHPYHCETSRHATGADARPASKVLRNRANASPRTGRGAPDTRSRRSARPRKSRDRLSRYSARS